MLADMALALEPKKQLIERELAEKLTRSLRAAHRFAFSQTASARLGRLVHEVPEMLTQNLEWAIPPFEQTWIEIEFQPFYEALGLERAPDSDEKIGFLIDHGTIYTTSCGFEAGTSSREIGGFWLPIAYNLDSTMSAEVRDAAELYDEVRSAARLGTSRLGLDQFFWGSAWNRLDETDRRALRERIAVEILPIRGAMRPESYHKILEGSTGDLRTVLTAMLLLTRPRATRLVENPRSRGWSRGKQRVYMEHSVVELDLDVAETVAVVGSSSHSSGEARRRHQVRGHWCQSRRVRDCEHVWREASDRKYECARCGGKRWWRRDAVRGDASKGWVRSTHEVTASSA